MVSNIPQLLINLAANTGPLKYGAAGFLYGLGNDGLPSPNVLAPLKPQVAAQKPEGGLQHPNGDALNVADTFFAAGGREIEVYIQDCYASWPYERLGMNDYLAKVETVVRQVSAHPKRRQFSFVPFNEPDQIWYNKTDQAALFFTDWNTVYRKIRAIDPAARLVGPNFASYDSRLYRDFLTFARDNACLPDVISWHELGDNFFSGWQARFEDYRAIERSLGLPAREICINEYARITGDLGKPGILVQWMARFEESKVDACLAYWTDAGSLNNLVTRDNYNKATGAWWLYAWYGGLTGHTLNVTPPQPDSHGLQGLAALDPVKKEARIIFGGSSGSLRLVLSGLTAAPYLENQVHAVVWETAYTGFAATGGPRPILESDFPVANGQVSIELENLIEFSAYQLVVTPIGEMLPTRSTTWYPAEFTGASGDVTSIVTAQDNGYYRIRLSCPSLAQAQTIRIILNGADLTEFSAPASRAGAAHVEVDCTVFMTAGINCITLKPTSAAAPDRLNFTLIDAPPTNGPVSSYEAEAPGNTVAGAAAVMEDPAASGGKYVGSIGNGAGNFLQFHDIRVGKGGIYRLVVQFANAEFRGGHSYNSQIVDRWAEIRVNGQNPQKVYFRNTFAWNNYQTRVVDVKLAAGRNTIEFTNPIIGVFAPNIDRIQIAAPLVEIKTYPVDDTLETGQVPEPD
jgi:hypothetical protein